MKTIMENLFTNKYSKDIIGIISCFDREIITGSLISLTYVQGLERHLRANHILLKDFKEYAISLAKELKVNSIKLCEESNAYFEYIKSSKTNKEQLVKTVLEKRGQHPGIVAVLHTLEMDYGFDIQGNKSTQKKELVGTSRKCLHIYFYFIDEQYGLGYFRVQTFFPFKIQVYLNGHEKLAFDMDKAKIKYTKHDNCFNWISNPDKAQELSETLDVSKFHSRLDKWVEKYVPILIKLSEVWPIQYQWSVKQIEYATDVIFNSEERLNTLFTQLLVYCNNTMLPEDVMSFLGKKLSPAVHTGKIHTSCKKTYNGYRIKHQCSFLSIKMYNKSGNVLRIELTINKLNELKVHREVRHKDGSISKEQAAMKKSIYSLEHIIRFGKADTSRYLDFLSKMEDNSRAISELSEFTERKTQNNRNFRGFNPLNQRELLIFQVLLNGALIANGFTSKYLKQYLSQNVKEQWTTSKISRLLRRLIAFNLVKKLKNTYKYFLTEKGRIILTMFLKLKNMTVVPVLNILLNEICPSLA